MMTDDDALSVTLTSVIASLVFILAWRSESLNSQPEQIAQMPLFGP